MSIKVIRFSTSDKDLFDKAKHIRKKVFVEEQNVTNEEEFDGLDDEATQYLVFFNDEEAGTGRRRKTVKGYKFERFAVYKNFRGKQIGKHLLQAMMEDVMPTNEPIFLNAQVSAQNFYAKYGFVKEGEIFLDANIEHYKMVYKK